MSIQKNFSFLKLSKWKLMILSGVLVLTGMVISYESSDVIFKKKIRIESDSLVQIELKNLLKTSANEEFRKNLHLSQRIETFYKNRNWSPVWWSDSGIAAIKPFLQILAEVNKDGLNPQDYHYQVLDSWVNENKQELLGGKLKPKDAGKMEIFLTDAFLRLGNHLLYGRINPPKSQFSVQVEQENVAPETLLTHSLYDEKLIATMKTLLPQSVGYHQLREKMPELAKNAARNGEDSKKLFPIDTVFNKGDSSHLIYVACRYLSSEFPERAIACGDVYDSTFIDLVNDFQEFHGLVPDGVLGPNTLAKLATSPMHLLETSWANLERWRWMSRKMGERNIQVYIPSFNLEVIENGREMLQMNVVVGKQGWETPMFSDVLTYLSFNPDWNVPTTIMMKDILPKIREDKFNWSQFELSQKKGDSSQVIANPRRINWKKMDNEKWAEKGYSIRQVPGPANPLGQVKFMFPNRFSVYLHDTPSKSLFNSYKRDFSHGCIRVEKPFQLVEFLMKEDASWSELKLQRILRQRETKAVNLPQPVPVHLVYRTAWVNPEDRMRTAPDIYGWDASLVSILKEEMGDPLELFETNDQLLEESIGWNKPASEQSRHASDSRDNHFGN